MTVHSNDCVGKTLQMLEVSKDKAIETYEEAVRIANEGVDDIREG